VNTRPAMTSSRLAVLAASLIWIGADSSLAASAEPEPASPAPSVRPERGPIDRDAMIERIEERIRQIDDFRARLAQLQKGLEDGAPVSDLIDPEDRWLFSRGWRDRGAGPGPGRPGAAPPESGPDRDPAFSDRGPMSDEDLRRIRAIIDEHIPQVAQRLSIAEADDPEAASRFLARIAPRFRDLLTLEDEAPELVPVRVAELRTGMEIVNAARELRRIDPSETGAFDAKKDEIRALLTLQLDLRHQLEEHRLQKMAADLKEARERLAEQDEQRDAIIDEHLQRVLRRTLESERRRGRDDSERGRRRSRDDRPRD